MEIKGTDKKSFEGRKWIYAFNIKQKEIISWYHDNISVNVMQCDPAQVTLPTRALAFSSVLCGYRNGIIHIELSWQIHERIIFSD